MEGLACLLAVTVLWGSYSPALRLAYNLPGPPSPAVLAAARGLLQLLFLLAALAYSTGTAGGGRLEGSAAATTAGGTADGTAAGGEGAEGSGQLEAPLEEGWPGLGPRPRAVGVDEPAGPAQHGQPAGPAMVVIEEGPIPPVLFLGLPAAVLAGLEIGLYNTTGTLCQTTGLALTTATRVAFLIQASILFTPLLASLAGMPPGRQVWAGSMLALAGTVLITMDHSSAAPAALDGSEVDTAAAVVAAAAAAADQAMPASSAAGAAATGAAANTLGRLSPAGDALIVFAALCYSAATVRIPAWSVQHGVAPLHLAIGKSAFLATVSAAALGVEAAHLMASGHPAADLWPGWQQPEGWALILWSAMGPGALAAFLHVKGQSLVSPTEAQVLFSSVPLWSALMAAVVLPGEHVGPATWVGGAAIAAAGVVAALPAARGTGGEGQG